MAIQLPSHLSKKLKVNGKYYSSLEYKSIIVIVDPAKYDFFFTDMHSTFGVSNFLPKYNDVTNTDLRNHFIFLFVII